MKKPILLCLAAALVGTAACANTMTQTSNVQNTNIAKPETPKASPAAHEEDNAPRITLADAKKDYDAEKAVFIDVREESFYKLDHIKGALNITANTLDANISRIPKGKKIIAYCS
ncbi:MAG: rhodanese-like domain-containing protein [Saprospiraceae bacterium]|nr:rhodanese-like domain-containing protein [Pyrinomonadaceae bacterium]